MTIEVIFEWLDLIYSWVKYVVPHPWLTHLHSAAALYIGYLLGQYALAERLKWNGYAVHVWTDGHSGQRRYSVEPNGLELLEEEDNDDSEW